MILFTIAHSGKKNHSYECYFPFVLVCVCVSTEHFCCYGFVRMRLNSFVLVYAHTKQAHIIIIIRTADIDGKPVRDRRGIYTQTDNLLT